MRKNKMMRVASVLLIAVLLTTCAISGTFAKYVTTGGDEDSARVAKFGVTVKASGGLFDATYMAAEENTPGKGAADTDDIVLTVESKNGKDKVVAPGTQNDEGLTLSVKGKPEVDVKVKVAIEEYTDVFLKGGKKYPDMTTAVKGDEYKQNDEYHPIVFTLSDADGEEVVSGKLAEVQAYLANTYEVYVDANKDLSEVVKSFTLTWAWDFDDEGKGTNDKADTLLGDLAAGTAEAVAGVDAKAYSTDVAVKLTVTVTQVD